MNDWYLWDDTQSKSFQRSREIDLIFERLIDFRDIEFVSREIEYGFEKYSTTNMLFRNILYYFNLNRDDLNRFREIESIYFFYYFVTHNYFYNPNSNPNLIMSQERCAWTRLLCLKQ